MHMQLQMCTQMSTWIYVYDHVRLCSTETWATELLKQDKVTLMWIAQKYDGITLLIWKGPIA